MRLGVLQLSLVSRHGSHGLVVLRLEGPGVNLEQCLPRFDFVALLELNNLQHAADLCTNLHAVLGFNGAHGLDQHRHRFRNRTGGLDGQRPAASALAFAFFRLGCACTGLARLLPIPVTACNTRTNCGKHQQHDQSFHFAPPAALSKSLVPTATCSRASVVNQSR